MPRRIVQFTVLLLLAGITTGCAPARATAAGGQPAPVVARPRPTAADVRFMQDMIGHHAQALVMARMAPGRTNRNDLQILSERIIVSQQDEIAIMKQWLRDQGATLPDSTAHHDHATMAPMPGMATPEELARLEKSSGTAFERSFLELMIRHHMGAVTMVEALFATPGAGQDDMIFKFASDIAADQESEVARMRSILATLQPMAPPQ